MVSLQSFEQFMASFLWAFYEKQTNKKKKKPALGDMLRHFMVYTLIDHRSRPISAPGFSQLLQKLYYL